MANERKNQAPPMARRPRRAGAAAFTLIEMLGVMMLISILFLATLPAFRSMHRAAMRQTAALQASELASALLAYRASCGQWPLQEQAAREPDDFAIVAAHPDIGAGNYSLDLADVMRRLRGIDDAAAGRPPFVELPEGIYVNPDTKKDDGYPRDPWGNPYVLVMARGKEKDTHETVVGHVEGGVRTVVTLPEDAGYGGWAHSANIDVPDDAAAFSWGDTLTAKTDIVGSWSRR